MSQKYKKMFIYFDYNSADNFYVDIILKITRSTLSRFAYDQYPIITTNVGWMTQINTFYQMMVLTARLLQKSDKTWHERNVWFVAIIITWSSRISVTHSGHLLVFHLWTGFLKFHSVDNFKKPNVNSSREQPLTTVTFQDLLDETHCLILPLSVDQIWQLRQLQKRPRSDWGFQLGEHILK